MGALRERISLTGAWGLLPDPDGIGQREHWHSNRTPSDGVSVLLPGAGGDAGTGVAWYVRDFELDGHTPDRRTTVSFEGLDAPLQAWLNGAALGDHQGGPAPFTFDLTSHAVVGTNRLTLRVSRQPRIWGDVVLEKTPAVHIRDVYVQPDLRRKRVTVTVDASGGDAVALSIAEMDVETEGSPGDALIMELPDYEPWTPENPKRYVLTCALLAGGDVVDTVTVSLGMRELTIHNGRLSLNTGSLPLKAARYAGEGRVGETLEDRFTRLRGELGTLRDVGVNTILVDMTRACPEIPGFCDALGVLIWADLSALEADSAAGLRSLTAVIQARRNHPSIGFWGAPVGNAALEPVRTDDIIETIQAVDSSRLIMARGQALRVSRQSPWFCRPYRKEAQPWDDFEPRLPTPFDYDAAQLCRYLGEPDRFGMVVFGRSDANGDSRAEALEAGFHERALDRIFSQPSEMIDVAREVYAAAIQRRDALCRVNTRLAGICEAGLDEDIARDEDPSPLIQGFKNALVLLQPVIHIPRLSLATRQEVAVSVDMINERRLDSRADLSLQVVGPTNQVLWKKKRNTRISKNGREIWSGEIAASGSTGPHHFVVRLMEGIKVIAQADAPFHVFPPVEPIETAISVVEEGSEWRERCNQFARVTKRRADVLVVPPLGNTVRAYPAEEMAQMFAEVEEGAVALVFSPPDDWNDVASMVDPATQASSVEIGGQTPPPWHYAKLHPVFEDLSSRGLLGGSYAAVMPMRTFIEASDEDICGVFAPGGCTVSDRPGRYHDETSWTGWGSNILVRRFGAGRLVFVHLRVLESLGADPVADRLFVNLLTHFARRAVSSDEAPKVDRVLRDWLRRERAERVRRWMVLGMFPNGDGKGHDTVFPPEHAVALSDVYPGWFRPIGWTPWYSVADTDYRINLDQALSPWGFSGPTWEPGVAYAYAEFYSPDRGGVTLELFVQDAMKVWLNGRLVVEDGGARPVDKPETLHCPAYLRQGKNTLLVKISKQPGPCRFALDLTSSAPGPLPITWWR